MCDALSELEGFPLGSPEGSERHQGTTIIGWQDNLCTIGTINGCLSNLHTIRSINGCPDNPHTIRTINGYLGNPHTISGMVPLTSL